MATKRTQSPPEVPADEKLIAKCPECQGRRSWKSGLFGMACAVCKGVGKVTRKRAMECADSLRRDIPLSEAHTERMKAALVELEAALAD